MEDYLKKITRQIGEFVVNLSPARRAALVGLTVAVVSGVVALFMWAGRETYRPIITNVSAEDSANVIRILREKRIPFRVDDTTRTISVPPESLDQLRLELATMGLPNSSSVGYEIFDKQSLGTTSFVQKVNQKRALEGELMRTINTIRGVTRSRVHLAIPQKSAFVEDQKKPTASVVLDLEPGTQLSEKQIYGVGNLVARAVEGMEVGDVAIVDSQGKTLSKSSSDPIAAATATQLDLRKKYEEDLEHRVEGILSRVVGEGRVVARVSAELDFAQVNETQTSYDADGSAVLSVDRDSRQAEGTRPGPVGAAGAAANTPGEPIPASPQVRQNTAANREITNYKVPETVRRTVRPGVQLKRLSVAVVVDGKPVRAGAGAAQSTTEAGAAESRAPASARVETWTADQLKEFESLIASAVGLDRKRGDSIEVKNMEFTREDFVEAERVIAERERKSYINNLTLYGVIGLAIALFFLLVVRPFIKWVTENTIDSVDTFLPQTIEELEKLQKNSALPGLEDAMPTLPDRLDPEKVEGEMIREKVITLIDAHPHKAALILKDWIHEDPSAKKKAEGAAAEQSA